MITRNQGSDIRLALIKGSMNTEGMLETEDYVVFLKDSPAHVNRKKGMALAGSLEHGGNEYIVYLK
ncbi:MAG: hypothetical protein WC763_02360 [Candidatus Paceibacterota bacterium]|jgi:hypothetical protein